MKEGYEIVNDFSYIIKYGDYYYTSATEKYSPVGGGSEWIGKTLKNLNRGYRKFDAMLVKIEKPRFKTDKPYPFGY